MQTAAIPYRVADFLKQYAPFQFMDESDLVALASHGRVKFHDVDEYICWQGSAHTPFLYVIQQGSVSLWDESVNPPALRDIRGAGDIVGLERFHGAAASLYSAKAASEVVLYALNAADFELLIVKYPRAAHYVSASFSVTADYRSLDERVHPHEIFVADLVSGTPSVQCEAWTSIQDAGKLMRESGADALALITGTELIALLTPDDLLGWVARGAPHPEQPARNIARAAPLTLAPQTLVSDCVNAMAESGSAAAALTTDGSRQSAVQAIVTAASMAPAFGDHPVAILREIEAASRLRSLRSLHERARSWILTQLSSPAAVNWLAAWADLLNIRILKRVLDFTGSYDGERLLCFYGAAGRRELLTQMAPRIAVIGNPPGGLEAALTECGYLSPKPPVAGSIEEWQERFSGWIRDPIRNQVHEGRPFFDLRAAHGSKRLFLELESHVRGELAAEPNFVRLLAHDCLSSLPPLTFFRDLVVEESGEQTDTFRLENSALRPLADVARVFAIAAGKPLGESTQERFQFARRLLPERESIFREAAVTMRVVLFHQARAGLRFASNGNELPLATLSRQDRQVLKSGFRSIHSLLEFTAPCDWLGAR